MKYAVFICTHGRPDSQYTLETLNRCGYTGKVYLIVDDEDDTVHNLMKNTQDKASIAMFNKQMYIDKSDTGTNEDQRKCILYAKNFCEDFAKGLNLDAFIIADDDITKFRYRYVEDNKLKTLNITEMDAIIEAYLEAMFDCDMAATGFGFTQFYFSGIHSFDNDNIQKYRVPYNFVFRNSKHRIDWMSWFGEDIITAVYYGRIGEYMTAIPYVQQEIVPLASADGGMKDTYDSNSDVRLAMQNVMYLPTELKAYQYKGKFMASINRDNAFPRVINSRYKKL